MVSKNYKTSPTQFLLHLLIALPINFLHHPLQGNQTKTSVTFGCSYLISNCLVYSYIEVIEQFFFTFILTVSLFEGKQTNKEFSFQGQIRS
jgi:hypothetical protein